jgi:methylenetetrahydrofolate dehydrogenase (NADP+) / methenyltetrahydrofolate cyclohydrolase
MKINGDLIAGKILEDLQKKVDALKKRNVVPHLAIILIGNDEPSKQYVNRKKIKGEEIGAKISVFNLDNSISFEELEKIVNKLNSDPDVHGIIIQRPLPIGIDETQTRQIVTLKKDVDGFLPNSKFNEPIAEAILEILKTVFFVSTNDVELENFNKWLSAKKIVVVGKGNTGGKPIINFLNKLGVQPLIVDSKTMNPSEVIRSADILISTVGKPNVINASNVKKGAIVIGIGMHKEEDGKLYPDYNQENIAKVASYFTPVPGGVGPVNVAMLLKNLVKSADN